VSRELLPPGKTRRHGRGFRFSLRALFIVTAVVAIYLGALVSLGPLDSDREWMEIGWLLGAVVSGIVLLRAGALMDVKWDWRRGLLRLVLVLGGLWLLACPFFLRLVLMLVTHLEGYSG
jgi:hypothetical protein